METFTSEGVLTNTDGYATAANSSNALTLHIEGQEFVAEELHMMGTALLTITGCNSERICERLEQLWNQRNQSCDVKIYVGGRFIRAHRAILAAASPLLKSIFMDLDPYESKDLSIIIPDVRYQDLVSLISFIYLGEVTVNRRRSRTLQSLLRSLKMALTLAETALKKTASIPSDTIEESKEEMAHEDTTDETHPTKQEPDESMLDQPSMMVTQKLMSGVQSSEADTEPTVLKTIQIRGDEANQSDSMLLKYKCSTCDKQFKSESGLRAHSYVHSGEKPFECLTCGKKYKSKDSLITHNREHTGERITCKICLKEFKHMRDWRDHRNIHTGEKMFLCEICSDNFPTKKQLFNHKEKHKTMPHPCRECGKMLKNQASYKAHMKNHDSARQHACNDCGKCFKRRFDLTVHQRIHSGEKPYTCNTCGKAFALSSTLAKHKRFHVETTEVYPCGICSKTFSSTNLVNDHRKTIHGTDPEQKFIVVSEPDEVVTTEVDGTGMTIVNVAQLHSENGEVLTLDGNTVILPDNMEVTDGTIVDVVSDETGN